MIVGDKELTRGAGGEQGDLYLRLALDAGQLATFDVDASSLSFTSSAELNRMLGFGEDETPDLKAIAARCFPGERERLEALAAELATRGDGQAEAEFRYILPDGSIHWLMLRATVLRAGDGTPPRFLGVVIDISGRHVFEFETARGTAMSATVLEASLDCIVTIDEASRVMEWNGAAERCFGHARAQALGRDLAQLIIPPDYRDAHNAGMKRYLETGEGAVLGKRVEVEAMRADGTRFPIELAINAVSVGGRRYFSAFLRDISARHDAEQQRRLLTQELAHRIKNTLALVQTITGQTLRQADDLASAQQAIEGRLAALAHAQQSLISGNWSEAPIGDIVGGVMAPYGLEPCRFTADGPDIKVDARQALALSLAIHELATNAIKYGALGGAGGSVSVIWRIEGGARERFALEWKERGGPPVEPPTRQGFGSRMIERALGSYFDGTASVTYERDGLRFVLDAPLGASPAD